MKEVPVTFERQGQQLVGMLHLPAEAGKFPAVVMFHGFTGNKQEAHRMFVEMSRTLAADGIASLRFDFLGSGDSAGKFSDVTLAGEIADAREALRFLRGRKEIDTQRIGILGMSMGGLVASFILAEDKNIKTAALWCPVGNPAYLIASRRTEKSDQQLATIGMVDMDGWPVGIPFVQELMVLKPIEAIVKTEAPLFILHAEKDESVPVSDMHDYVKALKAAGRTVESSVIAGANHTLDSFEWTAQALGQTRAWFQKKL